MVVLHPTMYGSLGKSHWEPAITTDELLACSPLASIAAGVRLTSRGNNIVIALEPDRAGK